MAEKLTSSPRTTWKAGFRALRHRSFRALWIGLLLSAMGTWMQIVAQSLLVLRLSHGSAFQLGCVSLAGAGSFFLFALVGGSFADHVDRRRLLLVTQVLLMLLSTLLGVLTVLHVVTVPMIAVLAFAYGVVLSFDQPTRAALVSTVVPQEDLLNAIALQSAVFNTASVVGPVLAGILIPWIGLASNFFLNAFSFVGVLLALLFIPAQNVPTRRLTSLGQIVEVLHSVRRDSILSSSLVIYGALLFAGPSLQLLLPVLAETRLHVGPTALGLLFSAAGMGAILGAIFLGRLHTTSLRISYAALLVWCLALAATGLAIEVQATFVALVLLGAAQSVVGSSTATLLQTRVEPHQRGRVMSLNTLLIMGVRPLGDFPAGALIGSLGAPMSACISGGLVLVTGFFVALRQKGTSSSIRA